jgi:hypothetical protein
MPGALEVLSLIGKSTSLIMRISGHSLTAVRQQARDKRLQTGFEPRCWGTSNSFAPRGAAPANR